MSIILNLATDSDGLHVPVSNACSCKKHIWRRVSAVTLQSNQAGEDNVSSGRAIMNGSQLLLKDGGHRLESKQTRSKLSSVEDVGVASRGEAPSCHDLLYAFRELAVTSFATTHSLCKP